MRLTCPVCGQEGEIRGTEEFFEIRGRLPGRRAIRKCRRCGSGLIVRPRLLFWGTRAEAIDYSLWKKMDTHFEREMLRSDAARGDSSARRRLSGESEDKTIRCPECGKGFTTDRARDDHRASKHTG